MARREAARQGLDRGRARRDAGGRPRAEGRLEARPRGGAGRRASATCAQDRRDAPGPTARWPSGSTRSSSRRRCRRSRPRTYYGMPAYAGRARTARSSLLQARLEVQGPLLDVRLPAGCAASTTATCGPICRSRLTPLDARRDRAADRRARARGPRAERGARAGAWGSIEVRGARENNLRDISLDIPKRRLTVFTGVSGSGKSSLVFGTIAAESQRLINETYSAFVQGFMPTLARPGRRPPRGADDRDHRRPGADGRQRPLDRRDGHRCQRAAAPAVQPARDSRTSAGPRRTRSTSRRRKAAGAMTIERGRGETDRRRNAICPAACAPAARAWAATNDIDLTQLYDETKSLAEGAIRVPGYTADGWATRMFSESGFFDPDKPIRDYTQQELHDFLYKEPVKVRINGINLTYEGPGPADPEVDAVEGRRLAPAAYPGVRRAGGDVQHLPRVRWHPAQGGRPAPRRSRGSASPTPARCRSATLPSGCAASTSRRWRRCSRRLQHDPRLVRRDRARLPLARPAVGHAVGRRGAADPDDPPPRLVADRRHLRLRRADDRAAPPRHRADERPAAAGCATRATPCSSWSTSPRSIAIADHVVDLGPGAGTGGRRRSSSRGPSRACGPAPR